MAGYSATPLPKKLGIKAGHRILLVNAPKNFKKTLGSLPAQAKFVTARSRTVDLIILFAQKKAQLQHGFNKALSKLDADGGLWVGWPKKTSSIETELVFNFVQKVGLKSGLVDNKVCAIDDDWSGLRFVYRVSDRAKIRSQREA